MTNYVLTIEIQDGAVQEILDELNEAQETIYRCYSRLMDLGVVTIRTAPPAKTDGASDH